MAQDKRSKSSKKSSKKQHQLNTNAKQAIKKKHLLSSSSSSTKSRNDDLREKLDRQSLSLHSELRVLGDPRPHQLQSSSSSLSMDVSESLTDLTAVLRNL